MWLEKQRVRAMAMPIEVAIGDYNGQPAGAQDNTPRRADQNPMTGTGGAAEGLLRNGATVLHVESVNAPAHAVRTNGQRGAGTCLRHPGGSGRVGRTITFERRAGRPARGQRWPLKTRRMAQPPRDEAGRSTHLRLVGQDRLEPGEISAR